jgi:hypothetical protein
VNSGAGEGLAVLPFYKNNPTLLIYIVKSDKSIVDDREKKGHLRYEY